jgi:L-alanine-DL-glutamate epimerase-like enolase superfamily enzyme
MRSDWSPQEEKALRERLVRQPVEVFEAGHTILPYRPGIGVELDDRTVTKYRV